MSVVVTGYKNSKDLLLKGAPDRIIEKCTMFMSADGTQSVMTNQIKDSLMRQLAELSSQGLRVLGFAEVPFAGALAGITE